jgi:hypothetical protein
VQAHAAKKKSKADAHSPHNSDVTAATAVAIATADTAVAPAARAAAKKKAKADAAAAAAADATTATATAIAAADTTVAPTAHAGAAKKKAKADVDASPAADVTAAATAGAASEVTRALKKAKLSGLVVVWASRYPSRGNSGRNAENDANTNLSAEKKASTSHQHDQL